MTKPDMTVRNNMRLIGNLQVYGKPYASLFIDKDADQLYVFVSVINQLSDAPEFLAVSVTSDDVKQYMDRQRGLKSLYAGRNYTTATIRNGSVVFESSDTVTPANTLEHEDKFDPEFCYDKLKLKIFLKRYLH